MEPKDKVNEFFTGLTPEERLGLVAQIAKQANQEITAKQSEQYINKSAGKLALMAGIDFVTKYDGKKLSQVWLENYGEEEGIISKAVGDYTGANAYLAPLVTFDRNDLLISADAIEYWNLIYEHGQEIMSKVTRISGTQLTGPIDIFALQEENLISSERAGEQPGTGLKPQVGIIGKEYFARNVEMQFDISQEQLMNKIYDPQFENKLTTAIYIGWSNDILRLSTNGVTDSYHGIDMTNYDRTDMYKLAIGWTKICQDGNGTWTNSNVQEMVLGVFGHKVTCNKYRIPATGATSIYTKTLFDTDVDGFIDGKDATGTIGTNELIITKGTTGDIAYLEKGGIACQRNKEGSLSVIVEGGGATSESYAEVLGSNNAVLGTTVLVIGNAVTTITCNFFTGENTTLKIRVHQTTNSETAGYDTFVLNQILAVHSGFDIIDYMNGMITNQPLEYKDKTKYAFIFGPDDLDKYAEAKGDSIRILAGNYVGINNVTREKWTVEGIIPRHKGHEVMFNPYMDSISETVTRGGVSKYGSIFLADPKDFIIYGLEQVQKYREFKVRRSVGGPGVEITTELWFDPNVTANEKIGIAFQGAKCETIVLMQTAAIKSTICDTGTTSAANGLYAYCDTKNARMFATLTGTVANIATLALAIAGVSGGSVYEIKTGVWEAASEGQSFLSGASWSFAAFKTIAGVEILDKSSTVACTFT